MQNNEYDGVADDPFLQRSTRHYSTRLNILRNKVIHQAERLVEHFKAEQPRLHARAWANATTGPDGRPSVSSWCSDLSPITTLSRGNLKIQWQNKAFGAFGAPRMFTYVRTNAQGDYSVKFLRERSKPYEVELVEQTEIEASILRARWRAICAIERGARDLRKTIRIAGE